MSVFKLFVGGLPYAVDDNGLRELFQEYGEVVEAKVVTDRETGRSRGFGFVQMSNQSEGQQAMESLDGSNFGGRSIVVKEAHDRR